MSVQLDQAAVAARVPALLRTLAGPAAVPHPEQLAAIQAVVAEGRRVLVVQRTGWGKSAVYFLATRLLRDAGAGPTFLISPLLALMRDQAAAAERVGVRAASINSTNVGDWRAIQDRIAADEVDLLLVSPERLNNPGFAARVLPLLTRQAGLVVVDEAHCISDWGHDFRPDYRRIAQILQTLGERVPVLGTTATANARVIADVGPSSSATAPSRCAARWTGPAWSCRWWRCPARLSGWPGWPPSSPACPGRASSTA